MGLFNNSIMMGSSGAGAYEIERSLRFDVHTGTTSGAHLQRTFSSAGNRKTWTFSFWAKKTGTGGEQVVFNGGGGGNGNTTIRWDTDDSFHVFEYNSGFTYRLHTNRLFRDPSAWYHIVVTLDTTQGTADNRIKIYVNGVQETSFANRTNPAQDTDYTLNNNIEHTIGNNAVEDGNANYFNGYLTEIHFVDGTALDASSFGKTDADTGQWIPKRYGGSHGTNGFYLNFSDNSNTTSGTLGDDDSANTNDWTPNNFSVSAGLGNDSFIDTPTNNFCTMNPLTKQNVTLTNGNLSVSTDGNNSGVYATMTIPSSGKWYFEMIHGSAGSPGLFFQTDPTSLPRTFQYSSGTNNGFFALLYSGLEVYDSGELVDQSGSPWNSYSNGTVYGFLFDRDNYTMKFRYNNGDEESCNEPTHTRGLPIEFGRSVTATWAATNFTMNFGGNGFTHTPPDGYKAISTANFPDPTILKGSDYYGALLWTGTDSVGTRLINGLDFNPDLHILKSRTVHAGHWGAFDSVRGVTAGKETLLNAHSAEGTEDGATYGYITPGTGGFTYNTGSAGAGNGNANYNWVDSGTGATYVAYNWKESATAGFDIVAYTGTGSATTVSHSLGVAPELIVVKNLTDGASVPVSISGIVGTGSDTLYWGNKNSAASSQTSVFPATLPTSSVFSVGTHAESNASSKNYIAYLWTSVEGYSKLGIYTGNGNSDGPFIYTGFKPAFLLIKCTSNAENWHVFDAARDPDNYVHHSLVPNNTAEENNSTTARRLDFTSNGIKMRGSDGTINTNNYTYLYMAFAERPFKYANAR